MEIEQIKHQDKLENLLNTQISQNKKLIKISIGLSGISLLLAGFTAFTLFNDLPSIDRGIWRIESDISALQNMKKNNTNGTSLQDKISSIEWYVIRNHENLDKLEKNFKEFEKIFTIELGLNEESDKKDFYGYFNNKDEKKSILRNDTDTLRRDIQQIRVDISTLRGDIRQIKDDTYWIRWLKN